MTIDLNAKPPTTSKCEVRLALATDCEAIAPLATQLGYPSTAEEIQRRIAEMADREQYALYVAESSDENSHRRIIGWIGVYVFRAVVVDKFAEISGLVVDESARCHGVGAKLLLAAEEWARAIGCHRISVRSNVVRDRAHNFYLRHDYEFTKAPKTFIKRLKK